MAKRPKNKPAPPSKIPPQLNETIISYSTACLLLLLVLLLPSPRPNRISTAESFLNWFVSHGGTIHIHAQLSIEQFPSFGHGLAVTFSSAVCPSVRRLDPLFSVPSSLIISVPSVLDTAIATAAASNDSLSIQSRTHRLFHRVGLHPNDLAAQDVLLAIFLMSEECQHRHRHTGHFHDSFWGPYLDMLPTIVPRLDTFDESDYDALDDDMLARTGRESRRNLERLYHDSKDSIHSILIDVIRTKLLHSHHTVPESCTTFEAFHRFVAVSSSRAMVLKGQKRIVPLADMMNYSPRPFDAPLQLQPPYDLFHTLSHDGSITVRSDRTILHSKENSDEYVTHQLFEDYGPVDSSLFLEAHGFVPSENPHHCASIEGSILSSVLVGSHENSDLVLRAWKSLGLAHARADSISIRNVCVRRDLSVVEDGNSIGRRPASDSISVAYLLLHQHTEDRGSLRRRCIDAIGSGDTERIELTCARYPGSERFVGHVLRNAAERILTRGSGSSDLQGQEYGERTDPVMNALLSELTDAQLKGREQRTVALKFRMEERRLLTHIAYNLEESGRPSHNHDPGDDLNLEEKLNDFKVFVESLGLPLNNIEPRVVGGNVRIGVFANDTIEVGDIYLSLPSNAVMDAAFALEHTDASSKLGRLLRRFYTEDGDGFLVLLIYLMHERFLMKEKSRWWPYLNLLPTIEEMRSFHPLFYSEMEMNQYLAGSDVRRSILRYQRRTAERHASLSSDLDANLVLESETLFNGDFFYWASAIIDSRSIWWDGKRHLALLDIVNADSIGIPHETRLEASVSNPGSVMAVTRASRKVDIGTQLLENYGQPNHSLFTFHGFILHDNPNDCALMDGLIIQSDDPGATIARRLLPSASPTFCINNYESLGQLAHFFRVKNHLPNASASNWEVTDDVRANLIQALEERIARLNEFVGPEQKGSPRRVYFMREIVRRDLRHFETALTALLSGGEGSSS